MVRMKVAKRLFVTGALILGTAWAGDAMNTGDFMAKAFQPEMVAEQGYVNPNNLQLVKKNADGKIAMYLQYNGADYPLMSSENGPRLGNSEYITAGLSQAEKYGVFGSVWSGLQQDEKNTLITNALADYTPNSIDKILSQEQKTNYLDYQWTTADNISKSALISSAWPELDIKYRHSLVKQELDQLLER